MITSQVEYRADQRACVNFKCLCKLRGFEPDRMATYTSGSDNSRSDASSYSGSDGSISTTASEEHLIALLDLPLNLIDLNQVLQILQTAAVLLKRMIQTGF